jgi:hypothetical protein
VNLCKEVFGGGTENNSKKIYKNGVNGEIIPTFAPNCGIETTQIINN